jgi:hypothetical protein
VAAILERVQQAAQSGGRLTASFRSFARERLRGCRAEVRGSFATRYAAAVNLPRASARYSRMAADWQNDILPAARQGTCPNQFFASYSAAFARLHPMHMLVRERHALREKRETDFEVGLGSQTP